MPSKFMSGVLRSALDEEIIVPILLSRLFDPDFTGFDIHVEGFQRRHPDGWFHPSTHPLWTERMLWLYQVYADQLLPERFDHTSTMAVTQGHFWHKFVQHVLMDAGVLEEHADDEGNRTAEVGFSHEMTKSRGMVDGVGIPKYFEGLFEFKTMSPMRFRNVTDLATFVKVCPDYYAQAIEYLRLSGYAQSRMVILSLTWPFEMREIVIPYDYEMGAMIRDKYVRVLQAVADQQMPDPCCAPLSTTAMSCIMRNACPVGRFGLEGD